MADESRAGRGRPVDAALTPAIVEAVLILLARDGYGRLTTVAVAKRAGVSTATLYRRWPSKRDLLHAAATHLAESEPGPGDESAGPIEVDLRELLAHKRRVLSGDVLATLISLLSESAHDPALAEIVRASLFESTRSTLTEIFDRARFRGERVVVNAATAANLIVGAILGRAAFAGPELAGILPEEDVALLLRAIIGDRIGPERVEGT